MYNYWYSRSTVTNCIVWPNTGGEISNVRSSPIVTYSDVRGGYTGTGNIDADIDSSGAVDLGDLCEFALHWAETGCGRCGGANLTCDGDVDWNDLRELLDYWLADR